MTTSREICLASRPVGMPAAENFALASRELAAPGAGEVLVQNKFMSVDPYMRGRMYDRASYVPPFQIGEALQGGAIGVVVESNAEGLRKGDIVSSMFGWREAFVAPAAALEKLDVPGGIPMESFLGVLGMPGLTAWAGMTQLAKTTIGDVVLVDAAAGPVGGTVGQVARINGATRVIGIAGGAEKCALVKERYQFDACIDYKQPNWLDALDAALGSPPTVHFENVGMNILLPALQRLKPYGRIVLCGLVDQYHATTPAPQIPPGLIVAKRAQLFGLVVYDFYSQFDAYVDQATEWIKTGALIYVEDRVRGLENAPAHFERLMRGENVGKAIVVVSDDAQ